MKKFITTSVAVAALLTSVQAESDFDMNSMVKDMKDAMISMSKDAKDSVVSMKDGAVETTQSGERTVTNVSKDGWIYDNSANVESSEDLEIP